MSRVALLGIVARGALVALAALAGSASAQSTTRSGTGADAPVDFIAAARVSRAPEPAPTTWPWPAGKLWFGEDAPASRLFEACARAPSLVELDVPLSAATEPALAFVDRDLGLSELRRLSAPRVVVWRVAQADPSRASQVADAFLDAGAHTVVVARGPSDDRGALDELYAVLASGRSAKDCGEASLEVHARLDSAPFRLFARARPLGPLAIAGLVAACLGLVALALRGIAREMRALNERRRAAE